MVLREKAVETCEKASIFKGFRAFLATPKPWVVGSSPSAPAKKPKFFNFGFIFSLAEAVELSPSVPRRLASIVVARRSTRSLLQLLVLLGRVTKNSYQLFFPRLPSAPAKNRQVSTETCRFYFFTLHSSLFTKTPLSIFGK